MMSRARIASAIVGVVVLAACAGRTPSARYSSRDPGCAVKRFPAEPTFAVEELGTVSVDCPPGPACERRLLDEVCARGGDVAWGFGENALSATHQVAHAAHSRRAAEGRSERGCAVRVFDEVPSMPTENIGPVSANCGADDSRESCLRELEDQVCLLGGDVLWQIEGPRPMGDKQRMTGRAAHTR